MNKSHINKLLTILIFVFTMTGFGFLLYSPVSNTVCKIKAEGITENFDRQAEMMNKQRQSQSDNTSVIDIAQLRKDSIEYNNKLRQYQQSLLTNETVFDKPALVLSKYGITDGVYGYVDIPKIDLKIPIYLGTQNDHMSYGAAHMTYTSLPIGDDESNCVLAGHTGYIGRTFFDNIKALEKGDEIIIRNYWSTQVYSVTYSKTVQPKDDRDIFINDKKSKIVLLTCTPNGFGSFDRYLVLGEKIIEEDF